MGLLTAIRRLLPAVLCLPWLLGCRPPPGVSLRDGGLVNTTLLVQAHPSWSHVAALDARIRALERGTGPAATIPPPEAASVESATRAFPDLEPSVGLAERQELQALIRGRVEADHAALVARLDEEVRRYAMGQEGAALARAEEGNTRRAEQFRSEYVAVVRRYADLVGPLILLQVALMSGLGDTAYFPPRVVDERGRRRLETEAEIAARRQRMDSELGALMMAYRAEVAERRAVARGEAGAAAEQYRQARLETLRSDRERQRRALEADLARALQEANVPPLAPIPLAESVFEGRREMAEGVLRANAAASRTHGTDRHRRETALAALRQERQTLVASIDLATRALAESVAREDGFRVEWGNGPGDPRLTERLLARLRERWAADDVRPGG